MVKVLTASGRGTSLPVGPVYFSRDYVRRGWLSNKTYPQGGRGVVIGTHKFLWRETHVDLRLPDGEYLLEVPIDYVTFRLRRRGRRSVRWGDCRRRCGGGRRLLGHRRRGEFNGRAVNCHADHLKRHVSAEPHTAEVD